MRSIKILAVASVMAVSGVAASAGGLAPAPAPVPVIIPEAPAAPESSINSGYIVLGLLAALVAASASF